MRTVVWLGLVDRPWCVFAGRDLFVLPGGLMLVGGPPGRLDRGGRKVREKEKRKEEGGS